MQINVIDLNPVHLGGRQYIWGDEGAGKSVLEKKTGRYPTGTADLSDKTGSSQRPL